MAEERSFLERVGDAVRTCVDESQTAVYDVEGKWYVFVVSDPFEGPWDGESEDGRVAFFFRDLVRKVGPGLCCFQRPMNSFEFEFVVSAAPHEKGSAAHHAVCMAQIEAYNETQAWANALLALHDAGLTLKGAG